MKTFSNKNILIFFGILLALTTSYWPVLFINYAYHDEYRFWENLPGAFGLHPFHLDNIIYGRFISSYLLTFAGWFINSVADLNALRFVNVLQLCVSALILTRLLEKYFQNNTLHAALAAIIIFTLPPFQVMASVGSDLYLPFTVMMALAAAGLASTIPPKKSLGKFAIDLRAFSAILCLFCGLSTYASAAMFYWAAMACIILSSGPKPLNEKILYAIKFFYVGFGALALYALFLKWTKNFYSAYVFQMYDPYQTSTNYMDKLQWFFSEPVFNSLNLWNVFPTIANALPVIILILSACLLLIFKNIKTRITLTELFFNVALCAALFILSFLPNLLAKGNAAFYRCSSGLTALMIIAMIWAVNEWIKLCSEPIKKIILTTILIAGSCYGIAQAQSTLLNFQVRPSAAELNYIKNIIKRTDFSQYTRVHLVLPKVNGQTYRYDEFGKPSTSFPQDFRGILACASREVGKEKDLYTYRILRSMSLEEKQPTDFNEPTLIIDMQKINENSPNGI